MTGTANAASIGENELDFGESSDMGDIANAPAASRRVIDTAIRVGLPFFFRQLDEPPRTAEEAAAACKCDISQIAQSIVFKGKQTKKPLLFIVSGKNQVNEKLLANLVGENLEKAQAEYVRKATGFAIGGVSPIGLASRLPVVMDEYLYDQPRCWIAAGTPNAVLSVPTLLLARMTAARIIKLD